MDYFPKIIPVCSFVSKNYLLGISVFTNFIEIPQFPSHHFMLSGIKKALLNKRAIILLPLLGGATHSAKD